MPRYTAQNRPYGVEIETTIPNRHRALFNVGHHSNGPQVPSMPDGWEARSDSSLYANDDYFPVELVSPILSGPSGLVSCVFVANWLHRLGAQPNESTGLHVHAAADDLMLPSVQAIRRAYIRYEMAFLALNGAAAAARLNNSYCKLSPEWKDETLRDVGRYCSLNTTNWSANYRNQSGKITLESRIWQSTNDDTRVVAAVSMFVALVQRAAELGARSEDRIESPEEAIRTFTRNHFGRGIRSTDLRIAPNVGIADVMLRAYRESREADKSLNPPRASY